MDSQFWSIERFVAFVLAPIVTPLSGALAIWLAKHFPGLPHVTGGAIYAFAATTAGGVAFGFIKWLDGRQKFVDGMRALEHDKVLTTIESAIPAGDRKSLLAGIEAIVKAEIAALAGSIGRRASPTVFKETNMVEPGSEPAGGPLDAAGWPTPPGSGSG